MTARQDDEITTSDTTEGAAFTTRTPAPSKRRVGAVTAAAVALAVGAVATSLAASPAPSNPSRTAAVPAVTAVEPGLGEIGAVLDHGRFGGLAGFRDISVSAISGSNITLETDDGWTRTITVTSSTELTKGGQEISVSDIAVGDSVRFRQERDEDGSYTVTAIAVVVPTIAGTVASVTSNGFTLETRDGSTWTITVDADTSFRFGAAEGTRADVVAGARVRVQGESTGDNALAATSVLVGADQTIGRVTAKTADTITIETRGDSKTIHVDGDTTYLVRGDEDGDLADIEVGDLIGVGGRARDDGSIDASTIVEGLGGRGFGGFFDGHGKGGFPAIPGWSDEDLDGSDDAAPSPSPSTTP